MRTSNRSPLGLPAQGVLCVVGRCLLMLAVLAFVGGLPGLALAADEEAEGDAAATTEEAASEEEHDDHDHADESSEHGDEHAEDEHADGDHGHHPHIGEPGEDPDLSKAEPDLAIFTLVVFVLLLLILAKFAWGPIVAGLRKREQSIADNISAAENANAEAHKLLAEYEKKLAAAQDQVRAMLDEARKDGAHTREEIVTKAKEEAAAEVARGKREIEAATQAAVKELSEQFAAQAVLLAGKLVHKELSAAEHQALINESLDRFQATQN